LNLGSLMLHTQTHMHLMLHDHVVFSNTPGIG